MRILVVCEANMCRSPMAEAYLRARAARETAAGSALLVDSAGRLGIEGALATENACRVLAEHGLDLSQHRSRALHRADLASADLVLVMTAAQRDALRALAGTSGPRIELLRAFESGATPAPVAPDLEDPVGAALEAYRECFRVIRRCADNVLRSLKNAP